MESWDVRILLHAWEEEVAGDSRAGLKAGGLVGSRIAIGDARLGR